MNLGMLSDIELAQQAKLKPIADIARELGIQEDELEPYGRYKAKLNERLIERLRTGRMGSWFW